MVHYQRRRRETGNFSIESLFGRLRAELPDDIVVSTQVSYFTSSGVLRRLANLLAAPIHQGDVNHVTGDVHYLAMLLRRKRTILTIHDCGFLHRRTGLIRRILKAVWLTWPVGRVGIVVAVSPSTRDEILRETGCPPEKVRVIPNAVVLGLPNTPKKFETEHPRILVVGTAPNKNLARLITATAGVRCSLDIVGPLPGEIKRALRDSQVEYSNSWNLPESEMRQRYGDCDIVAFPSVYEGFGLPILEAQTVGRPVLTSDVDPMRWVAGRGACLVDPLDVDSIREGIMRIVQDGPYRDALVREGYRNIERFTVAAMTEAYSSLYKWVGGRSPTC